MYDYYGFVIFWIVFVLLDEVGLKDVYWEFYLDVLNYFGFIYFLDNLVKFVDKIIWVFKVDECDCIDYIWYYFEKGLKVKDVVIFGLKNFIVCV